MDQISQRLRRAREDAQKTQAEAAAHLGLHRETITQIEAGQRAIQVGELCKLARFYGVSLDWLACYDQTDDTKVLALARRIEALPEPLFNAVLSIVDNLRRGEA